MKIAILWTRESGYFSATLRAAAGRGHEIYLFSEGIHAAAPFSNAATEFRGQVTRGATPAAVSEALEQIQPDVLLVAGWMNKPYLAIARQWRGRALRIMSMDNQWHATPKQRLGQVAFATVWRGTFEAAIVPGARQRAFARRLGFRSDWIFEGSYCADTALYEAHNATPENYFLYAGRNSPEKNVDVLLKAYQHYRAGAQDPWRLVLVGAAEFPGSDMPGVEALGFRDPEALAELMGKAGAFVLPSSKEPWGVVLHEAAAAGRFLLASTACGSSDAFLVNGVNGLTFDPGNVQSLSDALSHTSSLDDDDLASRSQISSTLAHRFHPTSWSLAFETAYGRHHGSSTSRTPSQPAANR